MEFLAQFVRQRPQFASRTRSEDFPKASGSHGADPDPTAVAFEEGGRHACRPAFADGHDLIGVAALRHGHPMLHTTTRPAPTRVLPVAKRRRGVLTCDALEPVRAGDGWSLVLLFVSL